MKKSYFLLSIVLILFFIYIKPIYTTIIFLLFFTEYIHFLNYFLKIYFNKTSYSCLKIEEENFNNNTILEIWLKINQIKGYKRFYLLNIKKKIKISDLFFTGILILIGFPFKIYKLLIFLLKDEEKLRDSLIKLWYNEFLPIKNKKIEILNNKIFLNCSTRKDLIMKIYQYNKGKSNEEILNIYKQIINYNNKIEKQNNIINSLSVKFKLGYLTTQDGTRVKKPHWTNTSDLIYNGEKIFQATHATSSVPEIFDDSQLKAIAIRDLVKAGSRNPGTIITSGDFKFKEFERSDPKFVASWKLDYVKYKVYGVNITSIYKNMFKERDNEIAEILNTKNNEEISEFVSGKYSQLLIAENNISYEEILSEINNMLK